MSTRAAIIKRTENGYTGIYCHNSGYVRGVGKTLLEHYNTNDKVDDLIALGWLSVLGERLHPVGPHSFDKPEPGTTVAYARDRQPHPDDEPEDNCPCVRSTLAEVLDQIDHQFYYLHENGIWTVNGASLRLTLAEGELITDDARCTTQDLDTRKRRDEITRRTNRRLIAPDLDLTRPMFDQTEGVFPLLTFAF